MKTVDLYTDGGCRPNPGVGAWAFRLEYKGHILENSDGLIHTTNNQMELTAILEGLKRLKERCIVNVYSDSQYSISCIELWGEGWSESCWKNPKKNNSLVRELYDECAKHVIQWHKIAAHTGHHQNELVDSLCTDKINELTNI